MTWECVAKRGSGAELVRLRFVEDPHYFDIVSADRLCDRLEHTAAREVLVDFDAWGDPRHGLVGFVELAINGVPLVHKGDGEMSGHDGAAIEAPPHPLERLFR
jgi:hypothetical protein